MCADVAERFLLHDITLGICRLAIGDWCDADRIPGHCSGRGSPSGRLRRSRDYRRACAADTESRNGGNAARACGLSLPTDADGTVGSVNNVSSLLVTGVVIVVTYRVVRRKSIAAHTSSAAHQVTLATGLAARLAKSVLGAGQVVVSGVAVLYLVAGVVWFVAAPDQFKANGHRLAALGLFVGIVLVAIFYACYAALEGKPEAKIYLAIAILLTVTLIVLTALILRTGGIEAGHAVLWFETALIVEFAAFWLVQTRDLWHSTRYRPPVTARTAVRQDNERPKFAPETAI